MSLSRPRHARGDPADESKPASPPTLDVPRRRPLVVAASIALVVATLISVTIAAWSAMQWKRAEDELRLARSTLQAVAEDREFGFAESEKAVEDTFWECGYGEKPLTRIGLDVLRNGRSFFARYVERDYGDPGAVLGRPRAYQYVGEINQWLGLVAESEAGYRESRRLLERLSRESPDADTRTMLALTNEFLGCLLVTTGRAAEAEGPASEAVAELESLLAEDPANCLARAELSNASRNLGLILAVLGRDGTEEVRRSIAHTSRIASELPEEITIAEYLVDTYQILAQLLWRQGRFSEAEDACRQSVREIDELLARFGALADRHGRRLRTLKYRRAKAMARSNLTRFRSKPEGNRPSADSWQWRPLFRLPGRLLQADLLVHGSLPGEFERQDAILMAWLDEAWCEETIAKMVAETYQRAQIILLVEDELVEEDAKRVLRTAGVPPDRVRFCRVPTNTLWVRDYGPMIIDTGDGTHQCVAPRRAVNSRNLRLENAEASRALSRLLEMPVLPVPLFLDGGHVLNNGEGLCLASARLLEKNGQVGYPESHVTNTIQRLFGATQVVYLEPLEGEPTGHVDWFAVFTSPDTLVLGDYRGTDPVNGPLLDRHAERLAGVTTSIGPLKIVRVPMPPRGEPYFGGTYTNVVFANGVLLVPSYPEAPPELEREAFDVFRRLLPGWSVVGIECSKFIPRQGALHCAAANLYRVGPPSWSGLAAGAPVPPVRSAPGRAGSPRERDSEKTWQSPEISGR
jgi:agmatine/peptidylarginine deiminase